MTVTYIARHVTMIQINVYSDMTTIILIIVQNSELDVILGSFIQNHSRCDWTEGIVELICEPIGMNDFND